MLTRNRFRRGEWKLKSFNPEVGNAHRRRNMANEEAHYEEKHNYRKIFYTMAEKVNQLLSRLEKEEERNS